MKPKSETLIALWEANPKLAEQFMAWIEHAGYECFVTIATTGGPTLATILEPVKNLVDLIILGDDEPGYIDGYNTIKNIRDLGIKAPALLMGYREFDLARYNLFQGHLRKPFTKGDFIREIDRVLGRGRAPQEVHIARAKEIAHRLMNVTPRQAEEAFRFAASPGRHHPKDPAVILAGPYLCISPGDCDHCMLDSQNCTEGTYRKIYDAKTPEDLYQACISHGAYLSLMAWKTERERERFVRCRSSCLYYKGGDCDASKMPDADGNCKHWTVDVS